jgi:hypothetical protein
MVACRPLDIISSMMLLPVGAPASSSAAIDFAAGCPGSRLCFTLQDGQPIALMAG